MVRHLVHHLTEQLFQAPTEELFARGVDVDQPAVGIEREQALAHAVGDRAQVVARRLHLSDLAAHVADHGEEPGSPLPLRSARAETSIHTGKRSPFFRWKVRSWRLPAVRSAAS